MKKGKKALALIVAACLIAGVVPVYGQPGIVGESGMAGPDRTEEIVEDKTGESSMDDRDGGEVEAVDDVPIVREQGESSQRPARDREEQREEQPAYIEGSALVLMKEETTGNLRGAAVDMFLEELYPLGEIGGSGDLLGAAESEQEPAIYLAHSDTLSTEALVAALKENPLVEYAEPDYCVETAALTDDTYVDQQWHLQQGRSPAGIQAGAAWAYGTGDPEYVVGVVDTGVDYTHPDLAGNMWTSSEGTYGYNGLEMNEDVMDEYPAGHGTHVAGIISACGNNGTGVSGVSQQSKIMALKMIDGFNSGSISAAIRCYEYAREQSGQGVKLAAMNNSWEVRNGYSTIFQRVIEDFYRDTGAVSVFASGNDSLDMDGWPNMVYGGVEGVITVDAVNHQGELAYFSNRGKQTTDLAAPGVGILSTIPERAARVNMGRETDPESILFREDFEKGTDIFQNAVAGESQGMKITEDPVNINGQCLEWTITRDDEDSYLLESKPVDMSAYAGAGYFALMCMPEDLAANRAAELVLNVDIQNQDGSWQYTDMQEVIAGLWSTCSMKIEEPENVDWEHFAFRISYSPIKGAEGIGLMKMYLDNIGFADTAQPYGMQSGTSMAAPAVSGGLALLRSLFPEETTGKIGARILGGVTRTEELEESCISGGYLNLEKAIQNPRPVLYRLSQDGDEAAIEGYFFGSTMGRVTLEGQDLEILDWQEEKVAFRLPENVKEGEWIFTLTRSENLDAYGTRSFEVKGANQYFEKLASPDPDTIEDRVDDDNNWETGLSMASWKDKIYVSAGQFGWQGEDMRYSFLWSYDTISGKWSVLRTDIPYFDNWKITTGEGKIYFFGDSLGMLYSWDIAAGKSTYLPVKGFEDRENSKNAGFASDDEHLWVIGGIQDGDSYATSPDVWKINKATWTAKKMPSLHYSRANCSVTCAEGKVIVTGGLDYGPEYESIFQQETEIWDGNQWLGGDVYPTVLNAQGGYVASGAIEGGVMTIGPSGTQEGKKQAAIYHTETREWEKLDITLGLPSMAMAQGVAYKGYFYLFARKVENPGNYIFLRTKADTPVPKGTSAPKNVRFSSKDSSISLSWGRCAGASGYVVYGYTGNSKDVDTRKIVRGGSNITWTEKKLAPGTQRRYVVRAYKNIDGVNYYSGKSGEIVTAVRPKGAVIQSAAAGKRLAKVTLAGKAKGAQGYAYCVSGDNRTYRIVAKGPKAPYVMRGLDKGVNYIKVRSYVKDGKGRTLYGTWSKVWKVYVK